MFHGGKSRINCLFGYLQGGRCGIYGANCPEWVVSMQVCLISHSTWLHTVTVFSPLPIQTRKRWPGLFNFSAHRWTYCPESNSFVQGLSLDFVKRQLLWSCRKKTSRNLCVNFVGFRQPNDTTMYSASSQFSRCYHVLHACALPRLFCRPAMPMVSTVFHCMIRLVRFFFSWALKIHDIHQDYLVLKATVKLQNCVHIHFKSFSY
jgi:hypothetical protein